MELDFLGRSEKKNGAGLLLREKRITTHSGYHYLRSKYFHINQLVPAI
jgi:hypothetical protein